VEYDLFRLFIVAGDSAELSCELSTGPKGEAYTVTWLKGNRPLDDRLADRVRITSQGDKHTLRLLNCRDEDSGLYTAKATTQSGSSTTCSAQLMVHECMKRTLLLSAIMISNVSPRQYLLTPLLM